VLAAIPYTTFPEIALGPLTLRTFGIMVALGVVAGTMVAARWGERFGVPGDTTVSLATRMVIAGLVGSRITWVLTHLDAIESPIDVIAVWEGGLQFSGGFIVAVAVGLPTFLKWDRYTRWRMFDGAVLALTVGAAIGRIGCYAVGEHLGGPTDFFLATRYQGGDTREGPLVVGEAIHNTALYEFLSLVALGFVLWWLLFKRRAALGTAFGTFLVWYSVSRFSTDFLRAYDETTWGLTGAQFLCLAMFPLGVAVLVWFRPRLRGLTATGPEADGGTGAAEVADEDVDPAPSTVPTPDATDGGDEPPTDDAR
jgi:phosphatidylglycerol---prolipoprotein diacylglyceryl transferase